MTYTNGLEQVDIHRHDSDEPDDAPRRQAPKTPPAHVIRCGAIETRIWANPTHWGAVTFRVDQVGGRRSRSLRATDLADAWRGLYRAQKWIRKMERRMTPRRFFLWNPF